MKAEEFTRGEPVAVWDEDIEVWVAGYVDDRDEELLVVRAENLFAADRPLIYAIPIQAVPQVVRTQ